LHGDEQGRVDLEDVRRILVWACTGVFAVSFLGLLGISATSYWRPDNSWIALLDRAWRISGAVGVGLWLVPRLAGAVRWIGRLFLGEA
jgi:hypothetical protein